MTPTNEAGHGLPELPEWAKRDDLGGLVPSQIRSELRAYARAALALSRGVPADTVPRALVRDLIVGAYNAGTQGVGFTQQLMELPDAPAAAGAQGEGADRCTDPENCRRCSLDTNTPHAGIPRHSDTPQPAAADGGVRERARELLAAEYKAHSFHRLNAIGDAILSGELTKEGEIACALRAIEAALSSHRQAGDAFDWIIEITGNPAYPVRITEPAGVNAWEPHASSLGAKFILAVKKLLTAPPPGADPEDSPK